MTSSLTKTKFAISSFLALLITTLPTACSNAKTIEAAKVVPTPAPKIVRFQKADCSTQKCVAITFDDGPSKHTLNYLKILDVPVTFFVTGKNAKAKPSVVRQASDEGHQICNHSYDHANFAKISAKAADDQIQKTDAIISSIIGDKYNQCLRLPYVSVPRGFFKSHPDILHISWSNDSEDWRYKDPKVQYKKVFSKPVPRNGIVLFHDVHAGALTTAPKVIAELKRQGFTFVTVDELNLQRGKVNMF